MEIWYSAYELTPRVPLGPKASRGVRHGALLRAGAGFADLHPWPELGDLPLDQQLEALAAGRPTPLGSASMRLAESDGKARQQQVSLFDRLTIPPSHYLWTDLHRPIDFAAIKEFEIVKVKSGTDIRPLLRVSSALRQAGLRARIDFNSALSEAGAEGALAALTSEGTDWVDFVEDPLPPGPAWSRLSRKFGVRFAADREDAHDGVAVFVHKPALRSDDQALAGNWNIVVTSYLDHPVGQMHAAVVAARFAEQQPRRMERCGLLAHLLYEKNAFSERIVSHGPRLAAPEGTGVGFDDLLEKLRWRRLT